jgi:uncharacterized membrane protein YccC
LQAAVDGLFVALSGWRIVALHLELLRADQGRREADLIQRNLPPAFRSVPVEGGEEVSWTFEALHLRQACIVAARTLTTLPARAPSLRLLADHSAEALIGIRCALDGLLLLTNPAQSIREPEAAVRFRIPDLLPSLVNAVRVFATIGAAELFWITSAWPNGARAIAFAAIATILFSPRGDQAYTVTIDLAAGFCLSAAMAAIIKFAVLPGVETFAGFSLAIGLALVPAGALMTQPWHTTTFMAMSVYFLPLLAPANEMSYDTQQFYNSALAIVSGIGAAALAFRLLPPLSPTLLTRRLLALTLRDLHRLTTGPVPRTVTNWKSNIFSRLFALPAQAKPLQRAQLLAAFSTGIEIIRLRRIAHRFGLHAKLDPALDAVSRGDIPVAIERLGRLDWVLATLPSDMPGARVRLRARGSILAMSEALAHHAAYFSSGAA